MDALFIGGTGTISMAISKLLLAQGCKLTLLNRGGRNNVDGLQNAEFLTVDINDENKVSALIKDRKFDVVADFIAFERHQLERDYRLFKDKCKQFIFISSASAYQKPLANYRITESTPLANPFWTYSQNKIDCEQYLMSLYREKNFPVTIVRPSHTYDERAVPLGVHGNKGSYQVIKRMLQKKPVIIHGDGLSLWTITHNSDFAKAFVGIMANIHAIGEAVHITSDESVTWNQIYECIAKNLGVPLNPFYISSYALANDKTYDFKGSLLGDKANSLVFDCSKIKNLVPGFVATKRADQGIAETVAFMQSHSECQLIDDDFDAWCDEMVRKYQY